MGEMEGNYVVCLGEKFRLFIVHLLPRYGEGRIRDMKCSIIQGQEFGWLTRCWGRTKRVCDRPSKRQENQKIQRVILSKPPLHPYFPKDPLSSTEVTFRRTCASGYWMLSFNKIVRTPLSPPKLRHTSSPLKSALTQNNITLVPEKKKN